MVWKSGQQFGIFVMSFEPFLNGICDVVWWGSLSCLGVEDPIIWSCVEMKDCTWSVVMFTWVMYVKVTST